MTAKQWLGLLQELQGIYDDATSTVSRRILTYTAGFLAQDILKRKLLDSGLLDKSKYGQWIKNNVFKGLRWKTIVFRSIKTMLRANRKANRVIEKRQNTEFKGGANQQLYDLEKKTGVDTTLTPYNDDAVISLLKQHPELLPRRKEDVGKAYGWEQTKIANSIALSISNGESVPDAAKRLGETLGQSNLKTMTMYARTAMRCAQNAGRIEAMKRAAAMGIHVQKKWLATLDERTRNSHRELDGQVREIEEDFRSPLGRISYPGDITAHPSDVWNCRCTLVYVYPDFQDLISNPVRRENVEKKNIIQDMTYREWEQYKKTGKPPQRPPKQPKQPGELERKLRDLGKNIIRSYAPDKFDQEAKAMQDQIDKLRKRQNDLVDQYKTLPRGPERVKINNELISISQQIVNIMDKHRDQYNIELLAKSLQDDGVDFVPITKLPHARSEEEIIKILAGGDKTEGSCASAGFAYVGQKAGLDILDFRGGASRKRFAVKCADILKSLEAHGLPVVKGTAKSYITAGKRALANVEEGKEYYFECASHAAIVRRVNGELEYLELQNGEMRNGWKRFNDVNHTLNWRFGAPLHSEGIDVDSYMVDIEPLTKYQRLLKLMGFINTRREDQKKGFGGHEK